MNVTINNNLNETSINSKPVFSDKSLSIINEFNDMAISIINYQNSSDYYEEKNKINEKFNIQNIEDRIRNFTNVNAKLKKDKITHENNKVKEYVLATVKSLVLAAIVAGTIAGTILLLPVGFSPIIGTLGLLISFALAYSYLSSYHNYSGDYIEVLVAIILSPVLIISGIAAPFFSYERKKELLENQILWNDSIISSEIKKKSEREKALIELDTTHDTKRNEFLKNEFANLNSQISTKLSDLQGELTVRNDDLSKIANETFKHPENPKTLAQSKITDLSQMIGKYEGALKELQAAHQQLS